MKSILLLVILFANTISTQAQPYQFFDDDFNVYSISGNSSKVFYNKTIHKTEIIDGFSYEFQTMISKVDDYSYEPDGTGFLGQYAVWNTNENKYILYNRNNDSITIFTNKPLGAVWLVWEDGSDTVFAEVTNMQVESYNGSADTIKTITFYLQTDQGIQGTVDSKTLRFSRERGILSFFNIASFPYLYGSYIVPVQYISFKFPELIDRFDYNRIYNLSQADMYNLHPLDTLHILTEKNHNYKNVPVYRKYEILSVIERFDYEDSICLRIQRDVKEWDNGLITSQYVDTVLTAYSKLPFEVKPYQALCSDYEATIAAVYVRNNKVSYAYPDATLLIDYDFYVEPIPSPDRYYGIEGLGGGYFFASSCDSYTIKALSYYHLSNGEVWGTPLDYTSIKPISQQYNLAVYPNPANDYLNIDSEVEIEQVSIFNVNGQLLQTEKVGMSLTHGLNISQLTDGVYYLQVIGKSGVVTKSFIKK